MGRKKGTKTSRAEQEAGAKNLAKYKAENPSGGRLSHGAHSRHVRKRYSDLRTTEGQQLKAIIDGIIDDLGGQSKVTNSQRLLLDNIKAKIIVILQISKYVDQQDSIIQKDGSLLPCLGRGFTAYSEAIRRDIQALHDMATKKPERVPTIEQIVNGHNQSNK